MEKCWFFFQMSSKASPDFYLKVLKEFELTFLVISYNVRQCFLIWGTFSLLFYNLVAPLTAIYIYFKPKSQLCTKFWHQFLYKSAILTKMRFHTKNAEVKCWWNWHLHYTVCQELWPLYAHPITHKSPIAPAAACRCSRPCHYLMSVRALRSVVIV